MQPVDEELGCAALAVAVLAREKEDAAEVEQQGRWSIGKGDGVSRLSHEARAFPEVVMATLKAAR
jgi:hypothetical protein